MQNYLEATYYIVTKQENGSTFSVYQYIKFGKQVLYKNL